VLLLQQELEALGELILVQLPGLVATQLPVQSLGQAGQDQLQQFTAHGQAPGGEQQAMWQPRAKVGRPPHSLPSFYPRLMA